jgi:hypothetical protein
MEWVMTWLALPGTCGRRGGTVGKPARDCDIQVLNNIANVKQTQEPNSTKGSLRYSCFFIVYTCPLSKALLLKNDLYLVFTWSYLSTCQHQTK